MARSRRRTVVSGPTRAGRRERHGRSLRSSVTGPDLPPLTTRIDVFESTVASTVDYLRGVWPEEMRGVTFEIGTAPSGPADGSVARWHVDHAGRRVTLYRVPIQRLSRLHRNDEDHRRMMIEGCVFRAVGELMGKDPWDIAPEDFDHF